MIFAFCLVSTAGKQSPFCSTVYSVWTEQWHSGQCRRLTDLGSLILSLGCCLWGVLKVFPVYVYLILVSLGFPPTFQDMKLVELTLQAIIAPCMVTYGPGFISTHTQDSQL